MNAFCPRCEKQISNDAAVCKLCGADFSDPQGWKPTTERGKGRPVNKVSMAWQIIKGIALTLLGLFIIVLALAIWLFSKVCLICK